MSNLEPIEEGDLDLKNKFLGVSNRAEKKETDASPGMQEIKDLEITEDKKEVAQEKSLEREKTYSKILSKVKVAQVSGDDAVDTVADDAKETSAGDTSEARVDKLIKLAMTKGVIYAVKVAKHMDDNYALDEFHDKMMAEDFHSALVEKGLIKEF